MVRYNHTATLNEDQTVTVTGYCRKTNEAHSVTMREYVYLAWLNGTMTQADAMQLTLSERTFLATGIMETQ